MKVCRRAANFASVQTLSDHQLNNGDTEMAGVACRSGCGAVTQSRRMPWPKRMLVAALLAAPALIPAQTFEYTGDYLTDVAHPRLWLPARRAKLLVRETTRDAL